jgi:hypothetical protein
LKGFQITTKDETSLENWKCKKVHELTRNYGKPGEITSKEYRKRSESEGKDEELRENEKEKRNVKTVRDWA